MIAVVITNNTFTKSAIETAETTQVLLWNRTKLMKMLNKIPKKDLIELENNIGVEIVKTQSEVVSSIIQADFSESKTTDNIAYINDSENIFRLEETSSEKIFCDNEYNKWAKRKSCLEKICYFLVSLIFLIVIIFIISKIILMIILFIKKYYIYICILCVFLLLIFLRFK